MIQMIIKVQVHLAFTSWVIVVGRFERHLLEHLVKTHINFRVVLNQVLEFANNGNEGFWCVSARFSFLDLFVKPGLQNVMILRQPPADSMMNNKRHCKLLGATEYISTTSMKK